MEFPSLASSAVAYRGLRCEASNPRNRTLNCRLEEANLVSKMRRPFDVLAEGLISENCQGDWTPLERFLAGVRGWEAGLRFNPKWH
jgi:hypothetical protein